MHTHDHDHEHGHHHHEHHHEESTPKGPVRFLYIDPYAGASGDMFLGALVDLGADFDELKRQLLSLDVPGFDLVKHATKRHTIAATKVDVVVEDVPHPHRHLRDLLSIVEKSPLSERVKQQSAEILRKLAGAESRVHRMPLEKVHLHEVGGLDCLVDIVGTCIALELLGIDRIVSGPVSVGTGTVACAHGRMPLPAPGTLAILENYPIRKTTLEGEMTTPTGAAIIATLATATVEPLVMTPRKVGYGAGTKDKKQIANMLRLVIAETAARFLPEKEDHHTHEHHHHDHDHDHNHDHHDHDHGHGHHHHHHAEEKV